MAKFAGSEKLDKNGYTLLPEGQYVMSVEKAEFNEISSRLSLVLKLENGRKHFETLFFTKANGEVNQTVVDEAIRFVRACLNDGSIKEFDSDDLPNCIGNCIGVEIQHNTWNGDTRAKLNPYKFEVILQMNPVDLDF